MMVAVPVLRACTIPLTESTVATLESLAFQKNAPVFTCAAAEHGSAMATTCIESPG